MTFIILFIAVIIISHAVLPVPTIDHRPAKAINTFLFECELLRREIDGITNLSKTTTEVMHHKTQALHDKYRRSVPSRILKKEIQTLHCLILNRSKNNIYAK